MNTSIAYLLLVTFVALTYIDLRVFERIVDSDRSVEGIHIPKWAYIPLAAFVWKWKLSKSKK